MREIKHRWGQRFLATSKLAMSASRLAGRRLFKREAGKADEVLGLNLAREMDQMKGLAMKIGQILSYFEGVLPPATHTALQTLQKGANPISMEAVAQVIADELGGSPAELFDTFNPEPIAAASIGQVHRAVFEGEPVAVKVQYPNVQKTFQSDFSKLGKIASLASLVTAVDGAAIADDLCARIMEECDYGREAAFQNAFADSFSADEEVEIPGIIGSRSTGRVLTSEWSDGQEFYAFVRDAARETKASVARTLIRFAFRSFFRLGTLNADPHPGNYLCLPDGRVTFLDFGCIRIFSRDYLDAERRLARVVVEDRRSEFEEAALAGGMIPKPKRFDFDEHWKMMCHQYQPYRTSHFTFTNDYVKAGMEFSRPGNPNLRKVAIPPEWIWQTRLMWGLHAVLAKLDASGNFRDLFVEALDAPYEALTVPGLIAS